MRRFLFGLTFAFGWLIACMVLVLMGIYPSPLWGVEGLQSGLFVLASGAFGTIATMLLPRGLKLCAFPCSGAVSAGLLIPIVSLCALILDMIGSRGYLPWILSFVVMQVALSLCLVFVFQALLSRVAAENALQKRS